MLLQLNTHYFKGGYYQYTQKSKFLPTVYILTSRDLKTFSAVTTIGFKIF